MESCEWCKEPIDAQHPCSVMVFRLNRYVHAMCVCNWKGYTDVETFAKRRYKFTNEQWNAYKTTVYKYVLEETLRRIDEDPQKQHDTDIRPYLYATLCQAFATVAAKWSPFPQKTEDEFVQYMMSAHLQAVDTAFDAIKHGTPNAYVGNPGIINNFDQTPLVLLVAHANTYPEWIEFALQQHADPNVPAVWRKC